MRTCATSNNCLRGGCPGRARTRRSRRHRRWSPGHRRIGALGERGVGCAASRSRGGSQERSQGHGPGQAPQHRPGADGRLLPGAAGHDAAGAADARRGCDVPQCARGRLALLPLARIDLHWQAAAPDRGADQRPQRPRPPDRWLPRVHPQRQYRQVVQRPAAEERLHDRVRRQVHERLRDVDQLPRQALRSGEGRRLGLLRGDPQGRLPRVGLLQHLAGQDRHDARPAHREAAAHGAAREARPPLRNQRRLRPRRGLPAQAAGRVEALLPRGRHLRSARPDDEGIPRQPVVPVGLRRQGARRATRPGATAAPGAAAHSRCRT